MFDDFWAVAYRHNDGPERLWTHRNNTPKLFQTRKSAIVNARKYLCKEGIVFDPVKYIPANFLTRS